jgi:hypothetical protein
MNRIEPIGPDRTVSPVEFKRLTPLEREEERQRREQQRKRRQAKQEPPPVDDRPGIDIRA